MDAAFRLTHDQKTGRYFDLAMIGIFSLLLYIGLTLVIPIQTKFEGETLLILQDLLRTHDFLSPSINNAPYPSFPPLYFWFGGLLSYFFGANYLILRGFSILCAVGSVFFTYYTTRTILTRTAARLSAIILATNLLFVGTAILSMPIQLNVLLTTIVLFMTVHLLFSEAISHRYSPTVFWISLGFFVLGSGLFLTFLLIMAIFSSFLALKRGDLIKTVFCSWGILAFLVIVLPWFILSALDHPHFIQYYFVDTLIENYTMFKANHFVPNWPALLSTFLGFMPWTIFLPSAFFYNRPFSWADREAEPLGVLFIFIALFFSIAFLLINGHPFIITILLPVFSIMCGRYLAPGFEFAKLPLKKNAYEILFMISIVALSYGLTRMTIMYRSGITESLNFFFYLLSYILIISLIALPILRYASLKKGFLTLLILSLISYTLGAFFIKYNVLDKQALMAQYIKDHQTQGEMIASYGVYPLDVPLALDQPIVMVNWQDMPLYAKKYDKHNPWTLTLQDFWVNVNAKKTPLLFIVPQQNVIQVFLSHPTLHIVQNMDNFIIFGNEFVHA